MLGIINADISAGVDLTPSSVCFERPHFVSFNMLKYASKCV